MSVSEEDLRDLIRLNDRMQRRMTDMKAEEQKAQADIAGMSGLLKALSMAGQADSFLFFTILNWLLLVNSPAPSS